MTLIVLKVRSDPPHPSIIMVSNASPPKRYPGERRSLKLSTAQGCVGHFLSSGAKKVLRTTGQGVSLLRKEEAVLPPSSPVARQAITTGTGLVVSHEVWRRLGEGFSCRRGCSGPQMNCRGCYWLLPYT